MATLEERMAALEQAATTLRAEHVADIRQLEERLQALQQQIIAHLGCGL